MDDRAASQNFLHFVIWSVAEGFRPWFPEMRAELPDIQTFRCVW